MKKILALALTLLFSTPVMAQEAPVKAVASFSILADIIKTVGGEEVSVTTLVGPDSDAHAYEPTTADAKAIADADVVFINGLGFEGWLEKLDASGPKIITVSNGIKAIENTEKEEDGHTGHHGHEHDHHDHGATDPHAWQDVSNVRVYVGNIATALSELRPDKAETFANNAAAYDKALQKLDSEIRKELASIPSENRKIITSHDAFGYFAAAYGVKIMAAEGLGAHGGGTALNISRLVNQIKSEGVKIIFLENISDPKLMTQIATDTGASIGGTLYADALSKQDGPAATYLDMMRHNLSLMAKGMGKE